MMKTPASDELPLRIYTAVSNETYACMTPHACFSKSESGEYVLYVPASLRTHDKLLRDCIRPNQIMDYYEPGTAIDSELDRISINVDVLGMSFVDPFFKHFAHLGPKIIAFALLLASLFLGKNPPILPHCVSPSSKLRKCDKQTEIVWPSRPRVVVGDNVIHNRKGVWNKDFTQMITTNSTYLHVQEFEK